MRLPTPQQVAARCRHWQALPVTIYGRTVTTRVRTVRALWYAALREQLLQIVLVRDPTGKRRDEAFFCTDPRVGAAFILEAYARRWTLEVSFHDQKQFLEFVRVVTRVWREQPVFQRRKFFQGRSIRGAPRGLPAAAPAAAPRPGAEGRPS